MGSSPTRPTSLIPGKAVAALSGITATHIDWADSKTSMSVCAKKLLSFEHTSQSGDEHGSECPPRKCVASRPPSGLPNGNKVDALAETGPWDQEIGGVASAVELHMRIETLHPHHLAMADGVVKPPAAETVEHPNRSYDLPRSIPVADGGPQNYTPKHPEWPQGALAPAFGGRKGSTAAPLSTDLYRTGSAIIPLCRVCTGELVIWLRQVTLSVVLEPLQSPPCRDRWLGLDEGVAKPIKPKFSLIRPSCFSVAPAANLGEGEV